MQRLIQQSYKTYVRPFRDSGEANHAETTAGKTTKVQSQSPESGPTSFDNYGQTIDENYEEKLTRTVSREWTASLCEISHSNEEILVLKDLSNPEEDFCINLSNPQAPVLKRRSMISIDDFCLETTLPMTETNQFNGHENVVDVDC